MSESDFRTLAKDVKEHGLKVPVVLLRSLKDGTTLLLDGISRLDALEAIGVQLVRKGKLVGSYDHDRKECQITTVVFDTECDPPAVVRSLNAHRRHLTPEQKREIIGKLLKVSPEKSDRQVAKLTGVSHPHVGKVRRSLEQTGDVETVSTSTDTKGRKQPRTKKRPKVPREVATHSHQDVGPESPREIARKLARLEELESTTRSLKRENIRLKSESATLSVNAFIGAGREERRRFLDGVGLDSLLDAMSADMLVALHQRLVAQYRSQPGEGPPLNPTEAAPAQLASEAATPDDLDIPLSLRRPPPAAKEPVR